MTHLRKLISHSASGSVVTNAPLHPHYIINIMILLSCALQYSFLGDQAIL